jgi:AcrR family transcriptional regulator
MRSTAGTDSHLLSRLNDVSTTKPRHDSERHRRPADRKKRIRAAARELFASTGYPNVSMEQIANEVGITAGALYRHFDNKTELLEQVFVESFAWLDDPLVQVGFDALIDEAIAALADLPYLADLWIHERRYLPLTSVADLTRRMNQWTRPIRNAIHLERPELSRADLNLLIAGVQSVLSSLSRHSIRLPPTERRSCVRSAIQAISNVELAPTRGRMVSRERLPISLRERLLLAASEQFGRGSGYHETSMADIGAAAGVTGASIYGYFENKAGVLQAVYERGTHALWIGLDNALAMEADARGAAASALASYVRIGRSWAATIGDLTGDSSMDSVAIQREYLAELVALLEEARPDLTYQDARLRIQIAFLLVGDLYRESVPSAEASFVDNLIAMVLAIVGLEGTALAHKEGGGGPT